MTFRSRRTRGWHHHGSEMPTSPRAILLHTDQFFYTFLHTTVYFWETFRSNLGCNHKKWWILVLFENFGKSNKKWADFLTLSLHMWLIRLFLQFVRTFLACRLVIFSSSVLCAPEWGQILCKIVFHFSYLLIHTILRHILLKIAFQKRCEIVC